MEDLEIELKFFVSDSPKIRNRILDLGADRSGKVFETNLLFEDAAGSLHRTGKLLRLRKADRALLTFKSKPDRLDPDFKTLRELEVAVDDFEGMRRILEALGYRGVKVYEKWRESFRLADTQFCLDTLPCGDFLEIEGGREEIRSCAGALGLDWSRRLRENYLEIFDRLKSRHRLPFSDFIFQNFGTLRIDLSEIGIEPAD